MESYVDLNKEVPDLVSIQKAISALSQKGLRELPTAESEIEALSEYKILRTLLCSLVTSTKIVFVEDSLLLSVFLSPLFH